MQATTTGAGLAGRIAELAGKAGEMRAELAALQAEAEAADLDAWDLGFAVGMVEDLVEHLNQIELDPEG